MNKDMEKQKIRNEKLERYLVDYLTEIYGDLEPKEQEELCKMGDELEVIKYEV
jgi:hypothetical protein